MTTATTIRPATDEQSTDRERREHALRWLLDTATVHHLPMPYSIEFHQYRSGGADVRTLCVRLDDDTDPAGWSAAVGAFDISDLPVTGGTHQWTVHHARTPWRDGPLVDFHQVTIQGRRDYRPRPPVDLAA